VVIFLEQGADCLRIVQLVLLLPKTPSFLALFTSRLVLPFWYRLIQVILEKRPLNGVVVVVVLKKVKVAHTRLPSVGFRSLQVT